MPHCLPHDDGEHFWWVHECFWLELPDAHPGEPYERETLLPLGPAGWSYDAASGTVTPSILCNRCGTHGFWRNGQWVPA